MRREKSQIAEVFDFLKRERKINENRELYPCKYIKNFKAGIFTNNIFFNPDYEKWDNYKQIFCLLHEESHKTRFTNLIVWFLGFFVIFGLVDILKNRGLPKDLRAIGSLQ